MKRQRKKTRRSRRTRKLGEALLRKLVKAENQFTVTLGRAIIRYD
jgi:hypothetical protein